MNLDYLHYLRLMLLHPLQKQGAEGAAQAVQLLDDYQLTREDVDSIMETSVWGGRPDPYSKLDSKVSVHVLSVYSLTHRITVDPFFNSISRCGFVETSTCSPLNPDDEFRFR